VKVIDEKDPIDSLTLEEAKAIIRMARRFVHGISVTVHYEEKGQYTCCHGATHIGHGIGCEYADLTKLLDELQS
jgi:hypothetical protein